MYTKKRKKGGQRKALCNLTKIAGKILLRYTVAEMIKKVYYNISYFESNTYYPKEAIMASLQLKNITTITS